MADMLSLKWIDGNDVVTLSGGTYTEPVDVHIHGNTDYVPTFDVDNPTMWTPLSVLSGLASGYCERKAALDPVFITGNTGTSEVPKYTSQSWADGSAARDAIVDNCMNNMALGMPIDSLFYSNTTAIMRPFGTAAASNYMTTMDAAIDGLIDTRAASYYVTAGGAEYTGFDGVAVSAVSTANAAGSAIQLPVHGGGTLKTTMGIGLPSEWAKERKWMMDELKWTTNGFQPIDADISVYGIFAYPSIYSGYYFDVYSYQDIYEQVLLIPGVAFNETATSGAISIVTSFDNERTFTHIFSIIPSSIIAIEKEDEVKAYDVFIDVPFSISGRNGLGGQIDYDVTVCRISSYRCPVGESILNIQPWTSASILVGTGATVTIQAASDQACITSATVTECTVTPTAVALYDENKWIIDGDLSTGIVTSGQFIDPVLDITGDEISNIAGAAGIQITGGSLTNGIIEDSAEPAVGVPITNVIISECDVTGTTLPASYNSAIGTSAGITDAIYKLRTLTIEGGGVVYIDTNTIRGRSLNLCDTATLYFGVADGASCINTQHQTITVDTGGEAAINVPNLFLYYFVDNICYIKVADNWRSVANKGVLFCTNPEAQSVQVDATYTGTGPTITFVQGGTYTLPALQDLIYAGYGVRYIDNTVVAANTNIYYKGGKVAVNGSMFILPGGRAYMGPLTAADYTNHTTAYVSAACRVASDGLLVLSSGFSSATNNSYVSELNAIASNSIILSGGTVSISGPTSYTITESSHAWNLPGAKPVFESSTLCGGACVATTLSGLKIDRGQIVADDIVFTDPTDSSYLNCAFVYDPAYITCTSAATEYEDHFKYTYVFTDCPIYGDGSTGIIYNAKRYQFTAYVTVDDVDYVKWVDSSWSSASTVGAVYTTNDYPIKGAAVYEATYDTTEEPPIETSITPIAGAAVEEYQDGQRIGTIKHAVYQEESHSDYCMSAYYNALSAAGSSYRANEFLQGATVSINTILGRDVAYREFNNFCMPELQPGWNTLTSKPDPVYDADDQIITSGVLLAGYGNRADAMAALSNCSITTGGVTVTGTTNAETFNDVDKYSSITAGFILYAVKPPDGLHNNYPEFYVRQFPTQAEIDQATSSATTT